MVMRSEAPESDPRTASFHDDRPEIQALFELALEGKLPRERELKTWEPQRLNERHLAMVMMRSGGLKQRQIARAFEATDSNVSIVLNHPDAEYLLSRLAAMKATQPGTIEQRLAALTEPAIGALEAVFDDGLEDGDAKRAMRRAPLAFKVLEINGHGAKRHVEVDHKHQFSLAGASPEQLSNVAQALRESRQIEDQPVIIVEDSGEATKMLSPGGESPASPPSVLSSDTSAPSISDPQEHLSGGTPPSPTEGPADQPSLPSEPS